MKRAILFLLCVASLSWGQFVSVRRVSRALPQVAAPTFDPAAGTYSGTQNVTIASTTSGASLAYCTDAADCTPGSSYSSPVPIATSTHLCAKATKTGYTDSSVACAAYTISASTIDTDSFAGAAADLNTHSSAGAVQWVKDNGVISLSGSGYAVSDDAFDKYRLPVSLSSADYKVSAVTSTLGDMWYVCGRLASGDIAGYCAGYEDIGGGVKNYKIIYYSGGSKTVLWPDPNTVPAVAGDEVQLTMSGTTIGIVVKRSGSTVLTHTVTDSSISAAGAPGLISIYATGNRFSSFKVLP